MINEALTYWDLGIIGLYFVFVIWLGIYFKNKNSGQDDYFLAGRKLLWPVIGLSLFASNMSSISLVGLAESGYSNGFAVFSYEWMASIVLIIFALFFLPYFLKAKIYTIPTFLEKRYSKESRYYFSAISILLIIFIDVASSLYAGSVVVKMVFPAMSLVQIIWVISIVAALYTLLGGLASVVYSDTVQAVLLIIGSIVITFIAFNKVDGWQGIVDAIEPENLTIVRSADSEVLPWPGLFGGVFLLGFYFWITNQFITQRALAAKTVREGQKGAVLAGFLKLITLFIMILPGVMAFILYPDLESAKMAYPTLVFDLVPTGLLGLIIAGFIAALMSSVDSGLNAASTLITFDFYQKLSPNSSSKSRIKTAKVATIICMLIAALWSPYIDDFPSLWDYLQMILSFVCPPIVALFIFGLFYKKTNQHGANSSIVTGLILGSVAILAKMDIIFGFLNPYMPHYLYLAFYIFVLCSLVLILVSNLKPVELTSTQKELVWSNDLFKEESRQLSQEPIWKNYRFYSVILVVVIAALLIIF